MAHPLETIWNSLVNKKAETEDFLRASMNRPETSALEDEYFPYTIKENSDNLVVKCLCEKMENLLMDIRDDVEKL